MAYNAGQSQMVGDKKFIDPLIADLITLSYECKRKYSPVKEVMFFCTCQSRLFIIVIQMRAFSRTYGHVC